jgi:hypothetical protein
MIRELLRRITRHMQSRVIYDRAGGSPYLSRFYILGCPYMTDGSEPINRTGNPKSEAIFPRGLGIYLHRFHRSDDDSALHNHPWKWSRSLILAGGYVEERRMGVMGPVKKFVRRPGSWVRINKDDFHRVDLIEDDCWSLFIAGPKVDTWGFWDRKTAEFLPWRDFITKVRGPGWEEERAS